MADAPHESYYYDAEGYPYHRRGVNMLLIILIGIFAVMSLYLAVVLGNQITPVIWPAGAPGIIGSALDKGGVIPGAGGVTGGVATPKERINIVFMGLDQRYDDPDNEAYRTDSFVIFTIDPKTKTAGAFSIPRDTWVDIPAPDGSGTWTSTRINTVYEYGEYTYRDTFPDGGAQLVKDTLEYNFGIPVDYYMVMNWSSFVDIIDQLGGIQVNVPEYAYDPAMSTCTFCGEYYPVEFVPGLVTMDGATALDYVRIRKSDNDFKRVERQQIVMRAIAARATSLEWLSLGKVRDLYGTYKDAIKTDVADIQLPGLAALAKEVGLEQVNMVSAAPALYSCESIGDCPGGASVQYINQQVWDELQASVFSNAIINREFASIRILNGTYTPYLAGTFADQVTTQGDGILRSQLTEDEYANNLIYPNTVIIDVNGTAPETIDKLQNLLGLPEGSVLAGTDPDAQEFLDGVSDIIVVLGEDAQLDYAGTGVTVSPAP